MSYGARTARRRTKPELGSSRASIEVECKLMRMDTPVGTVVEELRVALTKHKLQLLKLLGWERRKLEETGRRRLAIKRAREPGGIALHDPATGEWHDHPMSCECDECMYGPDRGGAA